MQALQFWYDHLGVHLAPALTPVEATGVHLPHRTQSGVKALRIGSLDAFYMARPGQSKLLGRIDMPSADQLEVLPAESCSPRKAIADWLLTEAEPPFMVGVITNANPIASMCVSHALSRSAFCSSAGRVQFDLGKLRTAKRLFDGIAWKTVAAGIQQYGRLCTARASEIHIEKSRLNSLLAGTPALRDALTEADIRPGSGEYTVLSWAHIGVQ